MSGGVIPDELHYELTIEVNGGAPSTLTKHGPGPNSGIGFDANLPCAAWNAV